MTWSGRVDNDVKILVHGRFAEVQNLSGTPYDDGRADFTSELPARRVNVTLTVRRSRGEVILEQQPSRENNYTAIVHIRDLKGGASVYEFELSW